MRFRQIDISPAWRCAAAVLCALSASACASGPDHPPTASSSADAISAGLQRLGASANRGDCYGKRVVKDLDAAAAAEAAAIVQRANSKDDMRNGVLSASKPVRKAFVGAKMRCSLA